MIPPTSIDGTDITGATIDGTDVQEITVDGQTVFSAETLPVAYSNLEAWYPFDSAEYGGGNADDVTATFNPSQSGDSTAHDGTVVGATFQATDGVTDINAGANSGAFEFDGNNDKIDTGYTPPLESSFVCWVNVDTTNLMAVMNARQGNDGMWTRTSGGKALVQIGNGGTYLQISSTSTITTGSWHLIMGAYDGNNVIVGVDGNIENTASVGRVQNGTLSLGTRSDNNRNFFDGLIDDARVYNKALSAAEFSGIYNNTEP